MTRAKKSLNPLCSVRKCPEWDKRAEEHCGAVSDEAQIASHCPHLSKGERADALVAKVREAETPTWQDSCQECGDPPRKVTAPLKWTARGDALCPECGKERDAVGYDTTGAHVA
jgi:hypothetical protein